MGSCEELDANIEHSTLNIPSWLTLIETGIVSVSNKWIDSDGSLASFVWME
jgi:hypothetical protein